MTQTKTSPNIPKLRFKDFSGEWEEKKLGEIAEFSKGKGLSKADIVENGKNKCIHYGELFTKYGPKITNIFSKTNLNGKFIFSKGYEILMPTSDVTPNGLATGSALCEENILLGGDILIIKSKLLNNIYFSYYIKNHRNDIMRLVSGSTVFHLYGSDMKTLKILLPPLPEQQKIASFLSSVDEKIESLKNKKELLEEYKKGVMQKIFSREIRFEGDFGEWEEKKLGEICNITTGKLDANAMIENGKYRFYTYAKDFYKIDDYAFDTDALLVSGNGANVGYIHHYNGKFNAYQRTYVLDNFKNNIIFIKYLLDRFLKKRILEEVNEGSTPYIVLGTLKYMKILLPSLPEQEKIADFLSGIDEKIESVGVEIEMSEEFKRGLLQEMFV